MNEVGIAGLSQSFNGDIMGTNRGTNQGYNKIQNPHIQLYEGLIL